MFCSLGFIDLVAFDLERFVVIKVVGRIMNEEAKCIMSDQQLFQSETTA